MQYSQSERCNRLSSLPEKRGSQRGTLGILQQWLSLSTSGFLHGAEPAGAALVPAPGVPVPGCSPVPPEVVSQAAFFWFIFRCLLFFLQE